MSNGLFSRMLWVARSTFDGWVEIQPFLDGDLGNPVAMFGSFADADLFKRSKLMDDSLRAMDELLDRGVPVGAEALATAWLDLQCLVISTRSLGRPAGGGTTTSGRP